jgi:hypothetical protein
LWVLPKVASGGFKDKTGGFGGSYSENLRAKLGKFWGRLTSVGLR